MERDVNLIVTHKIKMDLVNPEFTPQINAVQDDRYVRNIEFFLTADWLPWNIPEDSTVIVRYFKCDGKGGEYDTLPDKTRAYTISKNILTIALAPQVLTTAGNTRLSVTLSQGQSTISTFTVSINVRRRLNVDLAESESYYNVSVIEDAKKAAQQATTAANSANAVRTELLRARDNGEFNGATFTPSVSSAGVISWTNNKGLANPTSRNIRGPKGADGHTPVRGVDYWTDADKAALWESMLDNIPGSFDISAKELIILRGIQDNAGDIILDSSGNAINASIKFAAK